MATKMQAVIIKMHNAMDLILLQVIFPSSNESPSVSSVSPSIYKISEKRMLIVKYKLMTFDCFFCGEYIAL